MSESRIHISLDGMLIKADQNSKDMVVYVEASNENRDLDGETILQEALIESKDNFLKNGVISYDHLHKITENPEYIIGEPLEVKFGNLGTTFVKGKLYDTMHHAKTIYNLIKAGSSKVRASVGGNVLRKQGNVISKVIWDELALTVKPVNDELKQASITPLSAFAKSFRKGLNKDIDNLIHQVIPNDAEVLSLDIPGAYERSIFHIINALILGKIKNYDDFIEYMNSLNHTEIECTSIKNKLHEMGIFISTIF